jgi:hypothetical protein
MSNLPYARWFFYLIIASIISLSIPFLANAEDKLYTASIKTYVETNGKLQPTSDHIWVDGKTAAHLRDTSWLVVAVSYIFVECVIVLILNWNASRRKHQESAA